MTDDPHIDTLIEQFNEKHGFGLDEQGLKLFEEGGEAAQAVNQFDGNDRFREQGDADAIGDEIADVIFTARSIALLAGVDDIDRRVRDLARHNLGRVPPGSDR